MSVHGKYNVDDASYIVSLAAPQDERSRKLYAMPGKGFVTALKSYFGNEPVQKYINSLFKGVNDPSTLEAGKKRVYEAVYNDADISVQNQIKIVERIIAKMPIGKEYIQNIPYAQSEHLISVGGEKFFNALEATYGQAAVASANKEIFGDAVKAFSGGQAFQDRVRASYVNDTPLSPDDQKYIQNIVQTHS